MLPIWILVGAFAAAVAEMLIGSVGLYVPCFAVVAYYFAATLGWRTCLPWLCITGSLLDLGLGRELPVTLATLCPTALVASFWLRHGVFRLPLLQAIPGLLVGAGAAFVCALLLRLPGTVVDLGSSRANLLLLIHGSLGGALLTPLVCSQYDRMARALAFPRYQKVRAPTIRKPL